MGTMMYVSMDLGFLITQYLGRKPDFEKEVKMKMHVYGIMETVPEIVEWNIEEKPQPTIQELIEIENKIYKKSGKKPFFPY